MCTVSMIGDHYSDKWKGSDYSWIYDYTHVSRFEHNQLQEKFEALKKEVEEMKALLKRAKIYDEQNNEPNCEMEDKVALLKKIAALVGVSLDDVFGKQQ